MVLTKQKKKKKITKFDKNSKVLRNRDAKTIMWSLLLYSFIKLILQSFSNVTS